MEFWEFFAAMREQKRKGHVSSSQRLGDNQTWVPKYTDQDILDRMFTPWENQHTLNASLTDDDILDLLHEWDDEMGLI